jgi:dTDP-4-dehydrorhamnose reductase
MNRRILLIGKNGQIGRELHRLLLPHVGGLVALDRQGLDLTKPDDIRRAIRSIRPGIIVNAAANTTVDQAESDAATARIINTDALRVIAGEAKAADAVLVHYSTDYVFDGTKRTPYVEDDLPNPINVYGRTKLGGEVAIREAGVPHLIFRTEWVYATEGRNFLLTVLRLAGEREELRIVRDQIGAPTSSREIAKATVRILEQVCDRARDTGSFWEVSGVYHMTAAGETTWFDFAKAILEAVQSASRVDWLQRATGQRPLITRRIVPITTDEYPTPATRPAYSILSNSRLNRMFGISLPDWQSQLACLMEQN